MDLLSELTAADIPIKLAGRDLWLSPLMAEDWAAAAVEINRTRRSPLEVITPHLAGMSDDDRRFMLTMAYREERAGDLLPMASVTQWFDTAPGKVYRLWLHLRHRQPDLTLADVEALRILSGVDQFDAFVASKDAQLKGMPSGNSESLNPTTPEATLTASDSDSTSPSLGVVSIAS